MLINEIKPGAALAPYVRLYRVIHFSFPGRASIPFKAYPPRPEHCLQFMTHDQEMVRYPGSREEISPKSVLFMGPHTKVIHRFPGSDTLGFQVIFQPAAICQLLRMSARELTNAYLDAADIFGYDIHLVNEQLFHAANYGEMVAVAEQYLWTLIKKSKQRTHRVDELGRLMLYETEAFSLDRFLKAACLSHRQVDRMFRERIGMSPKQFLQLSRFDKVFRMKNRYPNKDWLTLALHGGYYDYQHLVKDYKEFTGYTPAQFFAIDNDAPERILGFAET